MDFMKELERSTKVTCSDDEIDLEYFSFLSFSYQFQFPHVLDEAVCVATHSRNDMTQRHTQIYIFHSIRE